MPWPAAQRSSDRELLARLGNLGAGTPVPASAPAPRLELYTLPASVTGEISAIATELGRALNTEVIHVGRTLIIRAPAETLTLAETLISRLPRSEAVATPTPAPAPRALRATFASPDAAAEAEYLRALLPEGSTVTGLPNSRSVVVIAPADILAVVEDLLIERRGRIPVGEPAAQAPEAPETVRQAFASRNVAADTAYLRALLPGIEITALEADRLIVVAGSREQQAQVQALLLARSTPEEPSVFYATTGNAEQAGVIARAITQELGLIATVYGTQIAVRGNAQAQERAGALIRSLQTAAPAAPEPREVILRSVRLSHADPATVVQALGTLGIAQNPGIVQTTTMASPQTPATQNPAPLQPVGNPEATTATLVQTTAPAPEAREEDRLQIAVDPRTNAILLRGTPAQVNSAAQAIAFIDERQELIEVTIRVEQVASSAINNLGINWSLAAGPLNVGLGAEGLSVGVRPVLNQPSISLALDALNQTGQSRTILNSRFTSISGQETQFVNGGQLVVQPITTGNNVVAGGTFSYGVETTFTPRLNPDGTVTVVLQTAIGQPPAQGAQNSVTQTRQSIRTTALVTPGTTSVLGGALTTTENRRDTGLPVLSRLPIVGGLFRSSQNEVRQENLVFVIEARVVPLTPRAELPISGGERVLVSPRESGPAPVVTAPGPVTPAAVPATPAAPAASPAPATVPAAPTTPPATPAPTPAPAPITPPAEGATPPPEGNPRETVIIPPRSGTP